MPNSTSEMEALHRADDSREAGSAYNSYQHDPPAVQQLGEIVPQRHAYYGDATLEPNTGLTNSYDYALFGLALHELLDRLRLSIIINAILTFLITFFTWWTRLFRPFDMALSITLGFLALILLVVDVQSIVRPTRTDGASASVSTAAGIATVENENDRSNRAKLNKFLKFTEQVGLMVLYHPIGRTLYLFTCGCLCLRIGGWWEDLLGGMFVANAGVLIYCWVTYPELRRTYEAVGGTQGEEVHNQTAARSASWSYYNQAITSSVSSLSGKVSEKASLLNAAFQKHETV